jgi:hypothetical protein
MFSVSSQCVANSVVALKKFNIRRLVVLCAFVIGLPLCALAQTSTIVGTVTDPSGAVVPNVTVTITSAGTGLSRSVTTNESGQYVVPDLQIGKYDAKAAGSGFKIGQQKGIVLNVGDRTRIDFKMEMGSATESVTVEENIVRVQTDSSEVSNVISGQQISQLATNGRSIYTLINLTPGASSLQGDFQNPTPVGGNGSTSFNGNRQGHNIYLLDGAESDDRGGAGNSSVAPSLDALAEFQTLTSNYSAEYGLSSGGTMTTALKSGTNQFHASAWEFVRNDALQAHRFLDPAGSKKTKLNYNTYGFNVGGPVALHQGGTPKTFFFYNMEWRKLIQGDSIVQTVPLLATYGGNFAGNLPADATVDKTVDPLQHPIPNSGLHVPCKSQLSPAQQALFVGQTFSTEDASGSCAVNTLATVANNPIFSAFTGSALPFVDSNAAALLNIPHGAGNPTKYTSIFPTPTTGNQFIGGNNSATTVREEIVRIDHNFTDKFSIFGHFVDEKISQGYGKSQWSGDNVPTASDVFGNPSYSGVVHTAYVINPSLINEAAFNYNGNRINIIPSGITQSSGFTFHRAFPNGPNAGNRIPSVNLNGTINKTGANYTSVWEPWINKADDYQIRDDVSWTRGKHQFKIGGSWALYKKIQDVFTTTQGNFTFDGSYTGNDFADYLLGYGQNYSEDAVKDNGHWNNVSYAAYFQDNWRATNRLTLNLGLRWDGAPHTYEANSRMSNFYPALYDPAKAAVLDPLNTKNSTILASSPGLGTSPNPILAGILLYTNGLGLDNKNGVPKGLVDNHWADFGPRVGFAYDVSGNGKTVVRGGFGLMYERVQGNDVYNTGGNVPFSANASFNNVLLSDPNTDIKTGSTKPLTIPVAGITGIARSNYKLPQSYQFSFGVQQALGKSVLSVSYVGTQNRHQNDYRETNLPAAGQIGNILANNDLYNTLVPYLGYRSIKLAADEANGHYNSLQMSLRGTFKGDLTYQVGYTLSRSIDPFGNGSSAGDLAAVSNPYVGWRYDVGPSAFDRTHVVFANFVYDLPILRHSGNRMARTTLGGWQVSGIVSISSGAPFNITSSSKVTSVIPNSSNRPDGKFTYSRKGTQWVNLSSLSAPADGVWGTLGHNAARGPGRDNWNIALFKSFVFSEARGSRLEFRAESFNTFNHTQLQADTTGGIHNDIGDKLFGQINQTFDPRTMQLGMKLIF